MLQAGAMLAASGAINVRAQDKGPLRIIVAFPAGGVADTSVRFFGEAWTAITKQSVVVENRPGGAYQIAMQALLSAPPDRWRSSSTLRRVDMRQLGCAGVM
jgi:tripartite-type tricarboxylate transporter receptor subunit TctC